MKTNLLFFYNKMIRKPLSSFLLFLFLLFGMTITNAQSISTPTIGGAPVCAGSTVTVTFNATSGSGNGRQFKTTTNFTPYLSAVGGGTPYTALSTFSNPSATPALGSGSNGLTYAITTTITIPSGTVTGSYRIYISANVDGTTTSLNSDVFSVSPNNTVSAASSTPTVCVNTTITPITHTTTGATGIGVATGLPPGVGASWSSNTITISGVPSLASASPYNYSIQLTGGCGTVNATGTITVNPLPAGTLTNTGAVCAGTQPQLVFTASAGTGPYTLIINGFSYNNITSGVPFTATGPAPTSNRTYTLTSITGANCSNTSASSSTTVTVNPLPNGTLTNGGVVCAGTQPQLIFTASSGTGPYTLVINGQTYTGRTSGVPFTATGIAPTSNTTYTLTSITGANCANPSPSASTNVTVNPTSVGGTISGSTSVCPGTNASVLTLSGHTGTVTKWQSSPVSDFSSGVVDIANTTTALVVTNLSSTTYYRAVVTSGLCPSANSSVGSVTAETTTWNGSAWSNGTPTIVKAVVFSGNYTASADFTGCKLNVTNNAVVTIPSGFSVLIDGAVTVDSGSSLIFENNANLLQNGSSNNNSGNIVVKRNSSALKRLDYTLWSSPVSGQQLQAFSPLTLSNRFNTYDTNSNLYVTVASPSTTDFAEAKGYLIRTPNNHPTTATVWQGVFTGLPNNGNYSFTMTNGGVGQRFNLVGNPYPSPIDATTFVSNNSTNITGTLYFWRKTNNAASPSYCSWTTAGFVSNGEAEVYNPNDIIRTGQGFFVEALNSATTVNFTNSMRTTDTANQFFRTTNTVERNRIWLNTTGTGGLFSQTMVSYMTGATNGVDAGIDGRYINDGAIALTSIINNERYAIQGKALPFADTDVIPLNFTADSEGSYSIAIDHVDGLFSNPSQDIFIKDNATNTTHNLRNGAYNFVSNAGSDSSRFELVFLGSVLNTYYQDLDNDNYGNTDVWVESDTQPVGYVLVGGDCNDNNPAVNPGATEICYNNIDDNCDGTKSEGCAPVLVFVNNPGTITNFSTALSAVPYSYSGATTRDYKFEIRNMQTNEVREFIQTGTFARFFTIPTDIRGFNTSYQIRAAAVINGEELNYFVAPITVMSPASTPVITLSSFSCNTTLSRLGATISATPAPNVIYYTFRLRLTADNGPEPTYYYAESASRFISLGYFSGLTVTSGTSYSIAVQYTSNNNGSNLTSNYGAECTVTTPGEAPGVILRTVETPLTSVGYPNPFSTSFTLDVKSSSTSNLSVKVYDMLGRIVEQQDIKVSDVASTSIGNNLPVGVYNVIVAQDNEVNTLRMIKR